MTTLLWVLVFLGGLNTVSALIGRFQTPVETWVRIADSIIMAGIGAWALWGLAAGLTCQP